MRSYYYGVISICGLSLSLLLSGQAFADSSTVMPMENATPMQLHTTPTTINNYQDFINASPSNECAASNETRDSCFVRFVLTKRPGGADYTLNREQLSCPAGYNMIASFGSVIYTSDGTFVQHYGANGSSSQGFTMQGTLEQFNAAQSLGATRVDSGTAATDSISHCINNSCDGAPSTWSDYNGRMVQHIQTKSYNQDTYNSGVNKCEHYTLSGCPSWCSRWAWEDYYLEYYDIHYAPGWYPTALANGVQPDSSTYTYTPTTIICGVPKTTWNPTP